MTVRDLIEALNRYDPDLEVGSIWDCTEMDVHGVHSLAGAVYIDCGETSDWEYLAPCAVCGKRRDDSDHGQTTHEFVAVQDA